MLNYENYFNNFNQNDFNFLSGDNLAPYEMNLDHYDYQNLNFFEGFPFEKPMPFEEIIPSGNDPLTPALESSIISQNENPFLIKNEKVQEDHNELNMVLDEMNGQEIQINEEVIPKIQSNEKIFEITKQEKTSKRILPRYPRIDDYKLYMRTKVNKYYLSLINELIMNSDLPDKLKEKVHSPSYKKFTEKVKCSSTLEDLQSSMNYILTLGYETQKNQRQNRENIDAIFSHYVNNPSERVQKIIELLNMTYEKVIEGFYDSKIFNDLRNDDVAKFYDEEFRRQKHFSLFEKNGLIRLFKSFFQNEIKNQKALGKKRKSSVHP